MTREELAAHLSENVRVRRLERIGEHVHGVGVAFDQMPADERQTWLDVADAVNELRVGGRGGSERLESIDGLVRMIVESDLGTDRTPRAVPKPLREMLIGHLTGALFVHTEESRCPS